MLEGLGALALSVVYLKPLVTREKVLLEKRKDLECN